MKIHKKCGHPGRAGAGVVLVGLCIATVGCGTRQEESGVAPAGEAAAESAADIAPAAQGVTSESPEPATANQAFDASDRDSPEIPTRIESLPDMKIERPEL